MMEQVLQPSRLRLRTGLRKIWPLPQLLNLWRRTMRRPHGETILLQRYARIHGKPLNLTSPQTYTEKLFWRMVTWNRGDMPHRFTRLTDKYAVRDYVAARVGEYIWSSCYGMGPTLKPFRLIACHRST